MKAPQAAKGWRGARSVVEGSGRSRELPPGTARKCARPEGGSPARRASISAH